MLLFILASSAARPAIAAPAGDADLPAAFEAAADEFGVPEELLLSLAWEASHWRADVVSAWGGWGLFDLREEGPGPSLERAAALLGESPDRILADPAEQVRAAAALLRWRADREGVGADAELADWWGPVRAFSGRQAPNLQDLFARTIFEQVDRGLPFDEATGLSLPARPVDVGERAAPSPPPACDYAGCDQFVPADPSNYSDYSRGPSDIDIIVIHTVQGSYSGAISWFQNPSADVSAHYVVRSDDGAVTQCVAEEDVAWHAGNWDYNLVSVGIEHEGYVEDPDTWYTDAMYEGSAALAADIAARNGIPVDRSHIIGHYEVPGSTHTDPGSGWDWDYYMALLGDETGEAAGDLVGVVADGDIYDGARLEGAFVWLEESGETTTTDADGTYRFSDLALQTWTVHACMDGYAEGTCTKDLGVGDNWCSIALEPGDGSCSYGGGGDDTGGGGGDDTGVDTPGGDTGEPPAGVDTGGPAAVPPPGTLRPTDELGGCGCATGGSPRLAWLPLLGLAFGLLRRRRA